MLLYRIAKTGSQSFIELLVQLEKKNKINPVIQLRQIEQLLEPPNLVGAFVKQVGQLYLALP